ncbi:hypothetical protein LJB80_01420 [Bacteroides sp. OttesenSCG-928-F21]|nr:hypothetical protein [Bacteroides sp. OttesenSCG-928-F21]
MFKNPYILIPLPVLRDLIVEKATIKRMLDFGIYFTAKKIDASVRDAYSEFTYCLRTDPEEITDELLEQYEEAEKSSCKTDHKETPKWIEQTELLEELCDCSLFFPDRLMEWCKVRITYKMLQLDTSTVKYTISEVERHSSKYNLDNCPFILVNRKVMMNLYEKCDNMKSDTRAMWAMYFGILSIIGKKEYAQTTSSMIKCRMFGAKNKEELNSFLKNPALKSAYNKYTSKYQYNKLLNAIQDRNLITEIGLNRRTYVSYKLKSIDELVDAISARVNGVKQRIRRNEAKAKAKERFMDSIQKMLWRDLMHE